VTSKRKALDSTRASRSVRTGYVSNAGAVVRNCTTPCPMASTLKAIIGTALTALYEYSPAGA